LAARKPIPSRTKDGDIVDFSTGSVGLGVGVTLFASLVQDYLRLHDIVPNDGQPGRMIALAGDAELDEGNIFEALLEGWKHDVRNLWWIIDYNRQSLDAVVSDRLFGRIDALFELVGWRVVTLKYGRKLEAAFAGPDGAHLREWIDACPNSLYSALVYKGGEGWREHLLRDLNRYPGIRAILDEHDNDALHALMTNLAGHDMEAVLDAFHSITDDRPTCFIAYTIKGYGLPLAGHKDNHAGLMNPAQMAPFSGRWGCRQERNGNRSRGSICRPRSCLRSCARRRWRRMASDGSRRHPSPFRTRSRCPAVSASRRRKRSAAFLAPSPPATAIWRAASSRHRPM
jgi:pyruvate dehydrogenase E1 component